MWGTRMGRVCAALTGVVLASTAAACQDTIAQSSSAGSVTLPAFYAQGIDWQPCEQQPSPPPDAPPGLQWQLECATMTVPLDYSKPDGEKITLALNRSKAPDQQRRIGSILVNPGGPGGSGKNLVAELGPIMGQAVLQGRYDIVGFDPRGVGDSTPQVKCLTPEEAAELQKTDLSPDNGDEQQRAEEMTKRYMAACQQNSGSLLPHVGTENVARDMDVMHAALGDDKLTYVGFSYGTYLGQIYAEMFPQNVGRMVLDSVADAADWPSTGFEAKQNAGFQQEIDEFLAWCAGRADCPTGTSAEQGEQTLTKLMADLDQRPLPARDDPDKALTEAMLSQAIVSSMYMPQRDWPRLESGLKAALGGDGGPLIQMLEGQSKDSSQDALLAITCLATAQPEREKDADPQWRKQQSDAAPTAGAPGPEDRCAHWPAPHTLSPHPVAPQGVAPILILNNTRDAATPIDDAREVAGRMPGAVLVENDGDGHGVFGKGPCVNEIYARYLLDGQLPAKDTKCADNAIPITEPEKLPS